ncbi:MAG: response regulator, partial [Phycisphaerales bacterium]|nr:response regulator [Phycisphaerales bacterium]
MSGQPTVYVVDDDGAMRRSTCMILEASGFHYQAFESALMFLAEYQRGSPGCLILDLHMPGMSGMELLQKLVDEQVMLPVIVVSGTGTIPIAVQGMKLGVEDFLEKPVHPDTLLRKVGEALANDEKRRAESAELDTIRQHFANLTAREREVLQFIVDGLPNKLIARRMDISIKTVTNHRANLLEKGGAVNPADLLRLYMLINPPDAPVR